MDPAVLNFITPEYIVLFLLVLGHCHGISASLDTAGTYEVQKLVNRLSGCHVHLIADQHFTLGPHDNTPMTITAATQYPGNNIFCKKILFTPTKMRGLSCLYTILYRSRWTDDILFHYCSGIVKYYEPNLHGYFPKRNDYYIYFLEMVDYSTFQRTVVLENLDIVPEKSGVRVLLSNSTDHNRIISLSFFVCSRPVYQSQVQYQVIPIEPEVLESRAGFDLAIRLAVRWGYILLRFILDPPIIDWKKFKSYNPVRLPADTKTEDLAYYIINEIAHARNFTWGTDYYAHPDRNVDIQFDYVLGLEPISNMYHQQSLEYVVTWSESFRFLTCYAEPEVSYRMYVQPFEPELWASLIPIMLVMALILHVYITFRLRIPLPFSPYFFILSTVIDEGYPIPASIQTGHFKLTFGVWLLLATIFTNGYVGLVINGLTAPLPFKSVEYFEQLVSTKVCEHYSECNQTLWWTTNRNRRYNVHFIDGEMTYRRVTEKIHVRNFENDTEFRILSPPVGELARIFFDPLRSTRDELLWPRDNDRNYKFGNALYLTSMMEDQAATFSAEEDLRADLGLHPFDRLEHIMSEESYTTLIITALGSMPFLSNEERVAFSLYNPTHVFPPSSNPNLNNSNLSVSSQIEAEVVQCGRAVYVDRVEKVKVEHAYLSKHYDHLDFVLGKDRLFSKMTTWTFSEAPFTEVSTYFANFISSGIYGKLAEYNEHEMYRSRLNFTLNNAARLNEGWDLVESKRLKIGGSIQTVFVIYVVCILLGGGGFLAELCHLHWRYVVWRVQRIPPVCTEA